MTEESGHRSDRVSRPGRYRGFSEPRFEVLRSSLYVASHDGTRLAVDVYRPGLGGRPADGAFPAIFESMRYLRRRSSPQRGTTNYVEHGYVYVVADQRGTGASFGTRRGDYTPEELADNVHLVEWIGQQPWSDGRVAMTGSSYGGITQLLTAALRPSGLVAIAPNVASFDAYHRTHPNGVWTPQHFIAERTRPMDLGLPPFDIDLRVDADVDGSQLAAAQEAHHGNVYPHHVQTPYLLRDTVVGTLGYAPGTDSSPAHHVDAIRDSGVAVFQTAGWHDSGVTTQLAAFRALGGQLMVGPWDHWDIDPDLDGIEHLRFFDRYLKDVDNGFDTEAPVRLLQPDGEWRLAPTSPLPEGREMQLHLGPGRTGSVDSVNDGLLAEQPQAVGADVYAVDREVAVFDGRYDKLSRRWDGDLTAGLDRRGLTYTGAALEQDLEVVGHPVVRLWLQSTASDGYLFAFLEDVDGDGCSRYVTDGLLRLSHRRVDPDAEPWRSLGVPFHPGRRADHAPLVPGEVADVVLDLYATSHRFRAGHRIRLTVVGAMEHCFETPEDLRLEAAPTIRVHRGRLHPSGLTLPVVDRP